MQDRERPLPSLYRNGVLNPDQWQPDIAMRWVPLYTDVADLLARH